MKRARGDLWRVERGFEASRTRPPSRTHLKGAAARSAHSRDDVRRRWAKRTESAQTLRALGHLIGSAHLPLSPLTAPLLSARTLSDCQASCLCRLERAEHLELRARLREIQDAEDRRRARDADQTLDPAELLY